MLQGKADIIRPFLYKRQQNNDSKYQSNTAQDKTGANAAPQIPFPVFRQLDNTDPVVADIIALQIVQKNDTDDGRKQHHHGDNCAVAEVRDGAEHFIIQRGCDYRIFTTNGRRDTKVGKAQKECLNKGCRKGWNHR